ncbi:hypothetical protein HK097_010842, partial [Rhizophlyctis rosea]
MNSGKRVITYGRRLSRRPTTPGLMKLSSSSPDSKSPTTTPPRIPKPSPIRRSAPTTSSLASDDPFAFGTDDSAKDSEHTSLTSSPNASQSPPTPALKRKRFETRSSPSKDSIVEVVIPATKRLRQQNPDSIPSPNSQSTSRQSPRDDVFKVSSTQRTKQTNTRRTASAPKRTPSANNMVLDPPTGNTTPTPAAQVVEAFSQLETAEDVSMDVFDMVMEDSGITRSSTSTRVYRKKTQTRSVSAKKPKELKPPKRVSSSEGELKRRGVAAKTAVDEGLGPSLPDDMDVDIVEVPTLASTLSESVEGPGEVDESGMNNTAAVDADGSATPLRRAVSWNADDNPFSNSPNRFVAVPKAGSRVARMRAAGTSPSTRRTVSFGTVDELGEGGDSVVKALFGEKSAFGEESRPPVDPTAPIQQTAPPSEIPPAGSTRIARTYARTAPPNDILPPSPTKPLPPTTNPFEASITSAPPPLVRPSIGITYGRSRSFLEDVADDQAGHYASEVKRRREEELDTSDEEEEGGRGRKELRSLHEVRESGEAKRFTDEMEYFLDGVRGEQGLRVRRSSCLELSKKMLVPKFLAKVRAHDFVPPLYAALHGETDPILLVLLSLMLLLLVQERRNVEVLLREPDLFDVLNRVFMLAEDPLKEEWGSSKFEKRLGMDVLDIFTSANVMEDAPRPLGLHVVTMMCLQQVLAYGQSPYLRSKFRESGLLSSVGKEVLDLGKKGKIAMTSESVAIPPEWNFDHANRCLVALEHATHEDLRNQQELVAVEGFIDSLMDVMVFCRVLVEEGKDEEEALSAGRTATNVLKLLLNLTNYHETWSSALGTSPHLDNILRMAIIPLWVSRHAQTEMKDGGDAEGEGQADVKELGMALLILSWGLLSNLVEFNMENRKRVLWIELGTACRGAAEWSGTCKCSEKRSAMVLLVDIFSKRVVISPEDPNGDQIISYLAILLGGLIKDNAMNRNIIRSHMPNKSFKTAIDVVEFMASHPDLLRES